jgi:hypothetical protein
LLAEEEVLDAIREQAYAPLADFPRYRKIRYNDIEHTEECYGESALDCDTEAAGSLSAAEYDLWVAIERAAPQGAELSALAHSCTCRACEAGLIRKSVRVTLEVGELAFTREYALEVE